MDRFRHEWSIICGGKIWRFLLWFLCQVLPEFLFLPVDFLMLIKVSFLTKRLITPCMLTHKRAFSCVHSQMVKKVVPLSENHVTSIIVTFQYFNVTIRLRVFISIDPELVSPRKGFSNFKVLCSKVLAIYYFDLNSFRYLSLYDVII